MWLLSRSYGEILSSVTLLPSLLVLPALSYIPFHCLPVCVFLRPQVPLIPGTRRVRANEVYQQYIKDKNHYHMNATRVRFEFHS